MILGAQQRTGAISGWVEDPSGAPIADAAIVVTSLDNGLERQTQTGQDGNFIAPLLPSGKYRVKASKSGFQDLVREGITVAVNEQPRIQLRLALLGTQTLVTVTEDAPQVNTVSAVNGGVIAGRQIQELPLNGRNFTELGTLIPGAVAVPSRFSTQGLQAARNGFSVNGMRTQSNNFLLDGVTNTDPHFNGYVVTPPPDAIGEFKILTSNFSAEYGNNAGSVVNVVTRAGTNALHGSLWNFLRNDYFDARNYFSTLRPPLRQNQYGASAGGPLVKNRTFLFGYWEGLRTREGVVQFLTVPSEAQRQGNFSGSTPAPRDPTTNQLFPGGVIPANRLNPIATTLLQRYVPLPNFPGDRINRSLTVATDGDQYGLRGDHRFSDKNTLLMRYAYGQSARRDPLGAASFSPEGSSSIDYNHSSVISDTHIVSPNLINEVSLSFVRQFSRPATWSGENLRDLGFQYVPTEGSALGIPSVSLSGLFSIGDVAQSWTKLERNVYQIYDNVSWTRGQHAMRFGFDSRLNQIYLVFPNRPNGDFTFGNGRTGNTLSDFLLGLPQQFRQGGGEPAKHFVGQQHAFYWQDDWKVTRRLTLNLGLRYELPIPFYDKQNRMASYQPGKQSTVRPTAPRGLLFPGDEGVPRATVQTDRNNFMPRFGFAYDVFGDGRTSVRGGYGIFYDAVPGVAVFQNINVPPFNRFIQVDTVPSFANPYANFAINPQVDPSRDFPCPCLVIGFSPDVRTPYAQHFNFTVQRQVTKNLLAEIGYVGSLGRQLAGYLEVNPARPGTTPVQTRRLDPNYSLVRPTFTRFTSNYHALQARLEKRLSAGLSFSVSYVWGKVIDYQSSVNFSGETRPQDAFSLNDVRGLAAFDVRHRIVANYTYDLPFFQNQRGVLGYALGGWRLVGIVSGQTGGPITAFDSVDRTTRGLNADRPDQIADPNDGPRTPQQWFNTAAFVRLPANSPRSGTAGRNTIIGPGLVQTDLSLIKLFRLWEGHQVQFRFEAFNAANRTNFFNPLTNISAPQTFGVIQGARPARILQLALKYQF
jgi:outer membrane receptor protein involved in Fe transport